MDERMCHYIVEWADAENYAATVGKRQAWIDFMKAMVSLDFERATAICDNNDFDATLLKKTQKVIRKANEACVDNENNTAAPA